MSGKYVKKIVVFLIKCYKFATMFTLHNCRFYPSCSTYACHAIEMYGFFYGVFLIFKRVVRCNPFCRSGFDPVPLMKK
ncbi:MAG: membrane protein insertion efficiency factor YidD [Endomicrobium sp.]|jgi:putative membrane protein insertion efficiency factor|nr:membrane protein insertion efficiency factor YidD [Endomicrobium sp.]